MKSDEEELYRLQENCMDIVQIAVDKMNKRPPQRCTTLKDIYENYFININEQQLRRIYNDRSRNFRSKSKRKTDL